MSVCEREGDGGGDVCESVCECERDCVCLRGTVRGRQQIPFKNTARSSFNIKHYVNEHGKAEE